MIIKRVRLKNVFSHSDTSVEFGSGINAIIGPNGAGKSSIIDGALLALFGSCTRAESVVRTELRDVMKVGSNQALIEVEFQIGGRNYLVQREMSRSGGSYVSRLTLHERRAEGIRRIAEGQRVCEEIMKLLNLKNIETLTATLVARQGHLTDLLDMRPAELKEKILDLAGFTKLEQKAEELKEELRNLQKVSGSLEILRRELEERKRRAEQLKGRIEEDQRLVKRLSEEAGSKEARLRAIEEDLAKVKKACELAQRIELMEKRKRELEDLRKELAAIEEKLRSWSEEDRVIAERILQHKDVAESEWRRSQELAERAARIRKELEELREASLPSVEEREEERRRLEEEIAMAEKRAGEIGGELKGLEACSPTEIQDRCPFCGAPLSREAADHIMKERLARREELMRSLREAEERRSALRRRLAQLTREIESLRRQAEERSRRLARLEAELGEVEKQISRAGATIEKYVSLCSSLSHKHGRSVSSPADCPAEAIRRSLDELRELEGRRKHITSMMERWEGEINEGELESLKGELALLSAVCDPHLASKLEREAKEAREELDKIRRELWRREGYLKQSQDDLERLRQEISEREFKLKELESEIRVYGALEALRMLFDKDGPLARAMTAALRARLQAEVNDILEMLERDFRVEIGEGFSISVRRGLGSLGVESLSGGEKTMLALAFRLALARVLRVSANTIILDEPTEFLDENARRKMFEIIRATTSMVDQMIVVTHDTEVEEMADSIIRISKGGEESKVSL